MHGCYWHRHEGYRCATTSSTRNEYWLAKFKANAERDRRNRQALIDAGWRVFVVWECALRQDPENTLTELATGLLDRSLQELELPRN